MLILQESCVDSSGSLVVYCPVDLPAINIAMSGEDPSYIPLLPSGFTISPDGQADQDGGGASTSTSSRVMGGGSGSGGSLITVAFQILVSSLPSAKLNMESVTTVNSLIGNTVQHIKAALNCPSSWCCCCLCCSSFLYSLSSSLLPFLKSMLIRKWFRPEAICAGAIINVWEKCFGLVGTIQCPLIRN